MDMNSVEQVGNDTQDTSPESSQGIGSLGQESANPEGQSASTLHDLDKLAKFRFEGREMTIADLKKQMLLHKDYTQKTQALSEERKNWEKQLQFAENLYADLEQVKSNPRLASEFMRIYPEKYHTHLEKILTQSPEPAQQQAPQQQRSPVDFETMSKIHQFESFMHEQKVAESTRTISVKMDDLSKKFPDADPGMALARVYDAHSKGEKITDQLWEKAFKEDQESFLKRSDARYKTMVANQKNANKKAADVGAGGGTPGRAPEKFKSLKDVTTFAANEMSRKG